MIPSLKHPFIFQSDVNKHVIPLAHAEEYFLSYQTVFEADVFLESAVLGGCVEVLK